MVDDYPTDRVVGGAGYVLIGVANHEYASITYLLELKLNETVIGGDELSLEHDKTCEQPFFFEATDKEEGQKVELLLYRDQDYNEPDETGELYRSRHLLVDIG